jgi:hypothetical protein
MTTNRANIELFRQGLIYCLKTGIATVTFTKMDGELRTIRCTLDPELLPETSGDEAKAISKDVLAIYALEDHAWKSFRWENLKSVIIEN